MYGVKSDSNMISAKAKQYNGLGRFSPWILEPSQSRSVGQKTNIISGVPEPARKRKGVESVIKVEASNETLLLNHLFSSKMNKNPNIKPIMMLGNLMA